MQQGSGEDSYARNSQPQQFLMENIIAPELLAALDNMTLTHSGKPIVVADLGCSSGLNTINNMNLILNRLKERFVTSAEVASDSTSTVLPDFQVFFNDLPSNDFNYLFQLLNEHRHSLDYFAAGVPGSFYGRLFPRSSVNVFFSSLCLHWMSKVNQFSSLQLLFKCLMSYLHVLSFLRVSLCFLRSPTIYSFGWPKCIPTTFRHSDCSDELAKYGALRPATETFRARLSTQPQNHRSDKQ